MDESAPVDITLLVYTILSRFLPRGTKLTSTYRAPGEQLQIIANLAMRRGIRTGTMLVDDPNTWVPVLERLRKMKVAVNAPAPGTKIPVSPHTMEKVVFDMSGASLSDIEAGCQRAQHMHVMGFQQILPEPNNNAVHVEVRWVNRWEWEKLYSEMNFGYA